MKILAVAALAVCLALPAAAQQNCGQHDEVVELLAERYGEARWAIALDSKNNAVEFFASTDTGTWTVLRTVPGGLSCVVSYGGAYESLSEPRPTGDPT